MLSNIANDEWQTRADLHIHVIHTKQSQCVLGTAVYIAITYFSLCPHNPT